MGMTLYDRYFWISTVAMIIIAYFSFQIAFILYGIYWIVKAQIVKRQFEVIQQWEQIEGEVVVKKVIKDCRFVLFLLYRDLCVYFPYIKYKFYHNGKAIYSDSITHFMYDYGYANEKDTQKTLRCLTKYNKVIVYKHPTKEFFLLRVEKGEYYNSLVNVHYMLAVFSIIMVILIEII